MTTKHFSLAPPSVVRWCFLLLLCVAAVAAPLRAQYTTEAFNLKKASELFDERGFNKGQTINVDGNLAVSNVNGSVSYSYPLDAFTRKGYNFNVSLNYCGSVTLSSFKKLGSGGTGPSDWSKLTANKPVWIIGLNGFAVQALSLTPDYLPPANDASSQWSDSRLPWLIEGYDYCNRMQRMENAYNYDVIRLLRSDGSVLELRNGRFTQDEGFDPAWSGGLHPGLVTGHYIEDAVNPRGLAFVEFDTTRMNSRVAEARDIAMDNFGEYWTHGVAAVMPRIVHYYPGDGLEYVFTEHQVPFGWDRYTGDAAITGGMEAGPTIFYLKEINDAVGPVLGLQYTRHEHPDNATPGRALLRSIGEQVELSYSDQFIVVESRGRTTSLRLEGGKDPVSDYVHKGGTGKRSYLPMIRTIIDPVGRRTYFNYENYKRVFRDYEHPYSSVTHLTINAKRLTRVVEPDARYDLAYYVGQSDEVFGGSGMSAYATGMADWRLNNVATSMQKYGPDGILLSTESYCFRGIDHAMSGNCGTVGLGTVYTLKDEITGKQKTLDYSFEKREILRDRTFTAPHPFSIPLVYTGIIGVSESADNESISTLTQYDSTGRRTIVMPKRVEVIKSTGGQNYTASITTYQYTTDTAYGFNGLDEVRSLYMRRLESKTEEIRNPANESEILLERHTDYLNLPFKDTVLLRQGLVWDKLTSLALWSSMKQQGLLTCKWEDMPDSLHVFSTTATMDPRPAPVFGLVKEEYTMKDNVYLGGIKNEWHEEMSYTGYDSYHRGLLKSDSIISKNRSAAILKGSYTYNNLRLPESQTNANGAYKRTEYQHPPTDNKATAAHNDGAAVQQPLYNRMWQLGVEKPAEEELVVSNQRTGGTTTLRQMYEWTFYGQMSGKRDYNGWYSRFDYDENGRLTTAWLPKDFMNPGGTCVEYFDGERAYPLEYGITRSQKLYRTKRCNNSVPETLTTENTTALSPLVAGIMSYPDPCAPSSGLAVGPGENNNATSKAKRDNPSVLVSNNVDITYLDTETNSIRLHFFTTGADNPIAQALDLRKLKLKFYIASMTGRCIGMEVKIGKVGEDPLWKEHYEMNCLVMSTTATMFPDTTDYSFTIDLSDHIDAIAAVDEGYVDISVPTVGGRVEIVSMSEDKSPRFILDGEFDIPHPLGDYTLHYDYSRSSDWQATVTAKVDDKYTTNSYYDTPCKLVRRTALTNILGVDRLLKKTEVSIGNPASPVRIDSTVFSYTGFGVASTAKDQEGWIGSTVVDGWNRPVLATHPDGNDVATAYEFGNPLVLLGDNDQEFYGLCERTTTRAENGKLHTQYKDALGRLRREMTDTAGLRLVTKYEYDELNRLTTVVNPAGDTTRYWYDDFGRVRYKYQPDIGYLSYTYDNLGNMRFAQTATQADSMRVTFTEYDELNRVTLIGEARLGGEPGGGGGHGHGFGGKKETPFGFPPHPVLNLNRLTDQLDGTRLNDAGASALLTRNASVWDNPASPVPQFWHIGKLEETTCVPQPVTELPVAPFLWHPTQYWSDPGLPLADQSDFENIAMYPENARIAIYYDELPQARGSVWTYFPNDRAWETLAPKGKIRNMQGNEVAVAYRQHAGEPYHYTVMSYDERNRVEAVLHYNENLGFDAVYYTYNALNQVTSVRVADPLRQYTTWYGYNHNGQVDTVWTLLEASGSGLGIVNPAYPAMPTKPTTPDIVYSYTKRGQIASMWYPPVNTVVNYAYNKRRFLDSMVATKSGTMLFRQDLGYSSVGNITDQVSQHSGQSEVEQLYNYDGANRIKDWIHGTTGYRHVYDEVGNRTWYRRFPSDGSGYFYTDPNGPNRLTQLVDSVAGMVTATTDYSYTADGALKTRTKATTSLTITEQFGYNSVQGLLTKYERSDGFKVDDWRYRYTASGEREQKRLYASTHLPVKTWDYYLLGGNNKQLAVYKGVETQQSSCGQSFGVYVYLWAKEYLTYGLGDVHTLTTRPVDPYTGVKEYKIQDHLGSTRVVLSGAGTVIGQYDYEPFGGILWQSSATPRKSYIDKERDAESDDHNFGVRQYSSEGGRFWSIDPWWEKYRAWSPYFYSDNNPLKIKDPSGKGGATAAHDSRVDGGAMFPVPGIQPGPSALQIVGGILSAVAGWFVASEVTTPAEAEGDDKPTLPMKPYAPDRPLPVDKETGKHIPDSDNPHTQLGTRKSTSKPGETYPQSREWGENGQKVKDIDWTDHGRPKQHTNPHQHRWDPKTGRRDDPEPLDSTPATAPTHSIPGSSRPSDI